MSYNKTYLRKISILLVDAVWICAAVYLAYLIRFDFQIPKYYSNQVANFWLIFILIRLVSFYFLGLYRSLWQYFGLNDVTTLIKGISLGTVLVMIIDYFRNYGIGIWAGAHFSKYPHRRIERRRTFQC